MMIIGTSHIAASSIKEIRHKLDAFKPDIVCLELDPARLDSLLYKTKEKLRLRDMRDIGIKGYLFALIAMYAQNRLGRIVGIQPGSDMLEAYKLAKGRKLHIELIDQPIGITLKRLSRSITWKEKWHFAADIIKGLFGKGMAIDLTKVPEDKIIGHLMAILKQRYPGIYTTLVTERNSYMARKVIKLLESNKGNKVAVIVGAAHVKGIRKIIYDHFGIF